MLGKWRNHMRNCIYVVMGGFVLFRKRHCSGVFIINFEQVNVSWGSTRRVHDNLKGTLLSRLLGMGHAPLYVTFSIRPSVRRAPYLRNRRLSDHNFWYTCVRWWYLQAFFSFFQNFDFQIVGGVKGQKWPKMAKKSVRRALYLRNRTSYDCHLWYTCVKW